MTTAAMASNLGGVALFALPGLGLAELFAPLARLPWWRRLGYAYLLGVVALGGTLFAASHLLGAALRRPAIAVVALAPLALGLAARAWRRAPRATSQLAAGVAPPAGGPIGAPATVGGGARGDTGGDTSGGTRAPQPRAPSRDPHHGVAGRRRRRWYLAAVFLIGAVLLGTLASALSVPLADWDGRMIWSALADYMRHEGTTDASVLRDARWFVMHPRYPPLLSVAQAAVQEIFGAGEDEQLYRAFYVGFLAALLLVIQDGAWRAAGAAAAALTTLCAALPHFLSYGAGGATSAYSDLPLAAFYGAALVLLLSARRQPSSGFAAGCLLAGAVLAKNEGEVLAAVALLLASSRLLRRRRRPLRPRLTLTVRHLAWFAAAALPVLAAAVLLASWRAGIPNRFDEDYFAVVRLPALLHGAVSRLPSIVHEALRLSFRWSDWQGFWVLFLAVLLAGRQAVRRPLARRMLLAGLAPAAIAWAAYAIASPASNLAPFISETWSRFLIQGLPPLAIVFACALHHLLRQLRQPAPDFADPAPGYPANRRSRADQDRTNGLYQMNR